MSSRLTSVVAAAALGLAVVTPAQAQLAVTPSPATSPVLGTVIRGTSATTFTISPSGSVTRVSGDAIRLTSTGVTAPTITISCGLLNLSSLCALRQIRVTVHPLPNANASITMFRVNSLSGNLLWAGTAPAPAQSLTFDLKPLGLLGTGSFVLGMDVLVAAGVSSGPHTFDYTVTATFI